VPDVFGGLCRDWLQHEGKWAEAADRMIEAARHIEAGGADFLILCTNTMHKTAGDVDRHVNIPLLHIADATADRIKAEGLSKIGLLGTRFTMEDDFYKGRLTDKLWVLAQVVCSIPY
jgi:aspartate racemase